jgi:hypothetical protein
LGLDEQALAKPEGGESPEEGQRHSWSHGPRASRAPRRLGDPVAELHGPTTLAVAAANYGCRINAIGAITWPITEEIALDDVLDVLKS